MDLRSLGYRTDLMLRRMAGASVEDKGDHLVVRTPSNPTFYWGNFLLFAAPPRNDDAGRWLAMFAAAFPDASHVAIGVDGTDGELGAADALLAAGLQPDLSVVLAADRLTPPHRVDSAATFRPLATDQDWQESVELRFAVDGRDDREHRLFSERRQHELRGLADAGLGVYVGAFVDGRLRAELGLYAADGLARYQSVSTHPDFRRRGLASSLMVLAEQLVRARQPVERLVIVADPSYVAIDIYRALGFRDSERQVQWQREPG